MSMQTFYRLISKRGRKPAETHQRKVDARIIRKLKLWVEEKRYCLTDQSLADVATSFEVSEETLSYFFSTVIKERFTSFRRILRLEEAHRIIMDEPDCKILDVASRVGIPDKCNFRKQFHMRYGCSPSEWRSLCAKTLINQV